MTQFSLRMNKPLDYVPTRSTVESMARELGCLALLQTAEVVVGTPNVTVGFDATTREGHHFNSIHFTLESGCVVAAIDELAGGTREDYSTHITQTVDCMAETYVFFHPSSTFEATRKLIINNISNSMTERCAANHAAISLVEQRWKWKIMELNCHLHPLDSIASKVRSGLKKVKREIQPTLKRKLFGTDYAASSIIVQMNKLRFKDAKGDPKGFKLFLHTENLGAGLIPRYRGNRLHVMFHIGGVLTHHFDKMLSFLKSGTGCAGLKEAIAHDMASKPGRVGLQVLGLLGKLLTGPWMKVFYTSRSSGILHLAGIAIVKQAIETMTDWAESPLQVLQTERDCFGKEIMRDDITRSMLLPPVNKELFREYMSACCLAINDVLNLQYKRYFNMEISEKLLDQTRSARSHNMDAEEIMGMITAAQDRAPNASMCFVSSKICAQKNQTMRYLENRPDLHCLIKKSIKLGRCHRQRKKLHEDFIFNLPNKNIYDVIPNFCCLFSCCVLGFI
ncbi:hypothetical protein CAPTEDRAFT_189537 [Capitella teleta]|uniref:Uncharacterized protein n=1 Tax=Capitella teleta TaxID=283909 RepID=R7T3H0_CAPTE|nr:hypothetical protein CAPTEDRAFT_189537 [Capitella teleta]|eukprot:ELT87136.1 hypothetical protein CAPTEDRAFT_189537 [Capitella teleta]